MAPSTYEFTFSKLDSPHRLQRTTLAELFCNRYAANASATLMGISISGASKGMSQTLPRLD
jgi:hypothetical protein